MASSKRVPQARWASAEAGYKERIKEEKAEGVKAVELEQARLRHLPSSPASEFCLRVRFG